jgi:hypothetical protein
MFATNCSEEVNQGPSRSYSRTLPHTTMFSLFFVAVLASVHSFTFVAATAEHPEITPAPSIVKRQGVAGASGTPILSTITYPFTALPEQVYPFSVLRGPQFGFNKCNSSTQGPTSNCQTLIVNSAVRLHFFDSCLTCVNKFYVI